MNLSNRIIELSKKYELTHVGSCLSAVDLIDAIYDLKKESEPFILSSGHMGLALYVVLEKYFGTKAELLIQKSGTHPKKRRMIDCSTGSLGQGITIAVGMATANPLKNVYCMVSDGEMAEGSVYEALRHVGSEMIRNLKIILNFNGWSAYGKTEAEPMINLLRSLGFGVLPIDGHKDIKRNLITESHVPIIYFAYTKSDFQNVRGLAAHYEKAR